MKELKMIFVLSAVILYSCAGNVKNTPVNPATSTSSSASENLLKHYDTNLGDPDTSLAIFLYENHMDDEYWENNLEEYIRWDLEYAKISRLLNSLYGREPGFEEAKRNLDDKRERFLQYVRDNVEDELINYHGVSGIRFSFLVERRDSTVIPTLRKVIADPKAPEIEVKYARETLARYTAQGM